MAGYEIRELAGDTPIAVAIFENGDFIQVGAGERVSSYIWSCPTETVLDHCHTLLTKARLSPGIGHLFIGSKGEKIAPFDTDEAISLVTNPELEPQITSLSCRFLSGVSLSVHRQHDEPSALVSALYFSRYGKPDVSTPSINELITSTASFELRRASKLLLAELSECTERLQKTGPQQDGIATVLPFKRPH